MSAVTVNIAAAFSGRLVHWALSSNVSAQHAEVLAAAGAVVAQRTSEGHVCARLSEVAEATQLEVGALRALLLGTGLVAAPDARATAVLVLDAADRLYLHRYYDYEARLARRLAVSLTGLQPTITGPGLALLAALFDPLVTDGSQWQRLAVAVALGRRLLVVSGGPGTGKTTTVAKLLACLVAEDPRCRIALAAPTGKAAARLGAALAEKSAALPAALQARLAQVPTTVHRLLGSGLRGFRHNAAHRLPFDVVVIDEASMLDVSLATHLLEAIPDHARIILLGDRDQLEAVESGAVFSQLCATQALTVPMRHALAQRSQVPEEAIDATIDPLDPMADSVIWFQKNYRFHRDSAIGRFALAIQAGDADASLAELGAKDPALEWLLPRGAQPDVAVIERLRAGYAAYYAAAASDADPLTVLRAFDAFRVLAAMREGPWGVNALNQWLARTMRERVQTLTGGPWYRGRPVLVTRNDRVVNLFNGDIGVTLPDASGQLRVWFPAGADGVRSVPLAQLPPHDTAFAMTVHKSQGSEFAQVAVILPEADSPMLSRELLYTAVTRAREQALVIARAGAVAAAVRQPGNRLSGLRDQLEQALHGAGQ